MFDAEMGGPSTVEEDLESLPDRVADALGKWRLKEVEKKREAARLLLSFKAKHAGEGLTITELKAMVDNDQGYSKPILSTAIDKYFDVFLAKRKTFLETYGI